MVICRIVTDAQPEAADRASITLSELTLTVAVFTDEAQGASAHPGRAVRPVDHDGAFAPVVALPWGQVRVAHIDVAKAHGRTERRAVQLITRICPGLGFPDARLAARITRTRTRPDGTGRTVEAVYAISDLPEDTSPERIGAFVRGHWAIETVSSRASRCNRPAICRGVRD